jgi:hypothetical protein
MLSINPTKAEIDAVQWKILVAKMVVARTNRGRRERDDYRSMPWNRSKSTVEEEGLEAIRLIDNL